MSEKKQQDIVSPGRSNLVKFMREVKAGKRSISKLTKRDEKFALMAELDGWKEFKKLADKRIEKLMSMRDYESAGRDLGELGLRFLVADIVAGEVEDLIKRVDQSLDLYVEEQKEKKKPKK